VQTAKKLPTVESLANDIFYNIENMHKAITKCCTAWIYACIFAGTGQNRLVAGDKMSSEDESGPSTASKRSCPRTDNEKAGPSSQGELPYSPS
jgi:hypothetical protein